MPARSIQFRTGYKRGGVAGKGKISSGGATTTTTTEKPKKLGFFKKILHKVRQKVLQTFKEQYAKAKAEGKETFTSTRDTEKGGGLFSGPKGKLHYATTDIKDVKKKIAKSKAATLKAKEGKGGGADSGSKKKAVYEKATGTKVSEKGQAYAAARKAGKDTYMYKGKKYTTLMKGEKPKKIWPEVSTVTSEGVKKRIGRQGGGRIADAARRAQIHGFYSPDMGMEGRGTGMPGPNVTGGRDPRMAMGGRGPGPGMARGRGYAKGGLIKGKPKLAARGW